jgi:methionyl-tRNA formyltransferase
VVEIVAVITQPDRPGHRGRVTAPPVKEKALELGLPVRQPARLRDDDLASIVGLRPDALVWAAYGNLVPRALIDAVGGRAVNVHPSLLPRWRGAEPVAHAILAGDSVTGVVLMEGTAELDAGPIFAEVRLEIDPTETTSELEGKLADAGGRLLERELPRYLRGDAIMRPQAARQVTWAPKLDPKAGALDFEKPAEVLARIVRAYTPDPGAYTTYRGQRIGVIRASVARGSPREHGVVSVPADAPHVATGAGWLRLEVVKPAGKREMSGADWARGARGLDGATLPS